MAAGDTDAMSRSTRWSRPARASGDWSSRRCVSTNLRKPGSRAIFLPTARPWRMRTYERCLAYAASYRFCRRLFCTSYPLTLLGRFSDFAIAAIEYPRSRRISISHRSAFLMRTHFLLFSSSKYTASSEFQRAGALWHQPKTGSPTHNAEDPMAKANVKKKVKPDRRTKAELIEALGAREEEVSIAQGETSRLQVALERATNKILQFSEQLAEKQKHLDGVREEARRTRNIAETLVSLIALENKPKVLKAKIAEALRRQRQELADYKDQVRWIVAAGYDQALSRDSEWPAGTDGSGAISFF